MQSDIEERIQQLNSLEGLSDTLNDAIADEVDELAERLVGQRGDLEAPVALK